ncbi:MAG: hypothetical protein J5501_00935 [Ruminococcus sp.]|nr:hypothetical protein [Ruminococcus sp.]
MEKDKKRTVHRSSSKKKNKPKLRFSIGWLIFIFIISFLACFILYMIAANFNPDFFLEEFDSISDIVPEEKPTEPTTELTTEITEEATETAVEQKEIVNPVPESAAAEPSYLSSCCLITGSELDGLDEHTSFTDVISNKELGAANCGTVKVESNYGTVTVYETVKIKKPANVYLMIGSDVGKASVDDQIAAYTALINSIKGALPATNIYVISEPPVMYDKETLTNEAINAYNAALLNMANSTGVYYLDLHSALRSETGTLSEAFWDYETLNYNEAGYQTIENYILTHIG